MQTSSEIKNISVALVEFHKEVDKISKDAKNPFFKSAYASLSNILEGIKQPLIKAGLSIVQFPEGSDSLTTRLSHVSGEWMEGTNIMKPVKDTPQDRGSALTYQRRYAIAAILSLIVDDDDDGNAASGRSSFKPASESVRSNIPSQSEKQLLNDLLETSTLKGDDKRNAFKAISECKDFTTYQKLQHRLEDLQVPLDQIQNPSQKQISKGVNKIAQNV